MFFLNTAGADPGFPLGGCTNPPGGANIRCCQIFAKKCMKLMKFWAGGVRQGFPLRLRHCTGLILKISIMYSNTLTLNHTNFLVVMTLWNLFQISIEKQMLAETGIYLFIFRGGVVDDWFWQWPFLPLKQMQMRRISGFPSLLLFVFFSLILKKGKL